MSKLKKMAFPVTLWEGIAEREKSSSHLVADGGQERRMVTRHAGFWNFYPEVQKRLLKLAPSLFDFNEKKQFKFILIFFG